MDSVSRRGGFDPMGEKARVASTRDVLTLGGRLPRFVSEIVHKKRGLPSNSAYAGGMFGQLDRESVQMLGRSPCSSLHSTIWTA